MNFETFRAFVESWWPYVISFVISVITAVRVYMGGPPCPSKNRIDGKVVLITGASSGIGFETAKELAARGGTIILACRNFEKGQSAMAKIKRSVAEAKLDLKILDVSEMESVRKFAALIQLRYRQIDVLINNAGIIFNPESKTSDGVELTLATNYLGPFLLTHLLLPSLRRSQNGRVVNITSLAHFAARININDLYFERRYSEREVFGQSKLALIMFSNFLAEKLKGTRITINSVNPGLVRNTNHTRKCLSGGTFLTKLSMYPWTWLFLKSPKQGCQSAVYAAIDPLLNDISGAYFSDCEIKEPADASKNPYMLQKLYEVSCELCKIDGEEMIRGLKK